jgi:signal transduction histidine kinase
LILGVLAWGMLIAVSWALNDYLFADVYGRFNDEPIKLQNQLQWEILYWTVWILFAPGIYALTRRLPLEVGTLRRNLPLHVAAGLVISVAHRAVYLGIGFLLFIAPSQPLREWGMTLPWLYRQILLFNLPTGFLSYGTIVVVCHLLSSQRRLQEEELEASRLKGALAEAQLQITRAQLDALKLQLHPHFLFNTLNSISALLPSNVEAADRMLARLGDLLRMTLDASGAEEVALARELEQLQCYLEIERVRFRDRLTVQLAVEPEALEARVPNLILQPLVENAVRHGIARRIAPGSVIVSARREGDRLRLQVEDDGPGPPADADLEPFAKKGVGLANTRARLQHLYGPAHRLAIEKAPSGGTRVTLEIPFLPTAAGAPREGATAR